METMSSPFSKPPSNARITPSAFTASIPEEDLNDLRTLAKLAKLAPPTYENSQPDFRWGVTSDWLATIREKWINDFDWRKCESRINSFPQFTSEIEGLTLHFTALFSEKPDAVPIVLLHGWPGSFLEFLPMLQLFKDEFSPSTLPYHLIVPSLPGYGFSSGPPVDMDFSTEDVARVIDRLMQDLGFASGYVAQGGDIGSRVSRNLAVDFECCKAVHLNFTAIAFTPPGVSDDNLTDFEKKGLARKDAFLTRGIAYAFEHNTKTSTIGHVLASSPLALLAWCGEKFLTWVDDPLPSETILELVSLYWLTETFPRAIYPYREEKFPVTPEPSNLKYIQKPLGFSYFPNELFPVPKSWVETTGHLVFWRAHQRGGHFAALEKPAELKKDLTDFVNQVWPSLGYL
ncbi:Alpha/Beta hydrolase protein [Aspergillus avenaceus]|uniref:Alpha/Beta hydrolase protein n=1 Tax=Aspergillus avenaceus TaxID=36643 RepID=A0A5N6U601_ASPAV|nr:Alpha/Beta hydrolase protein [Aspergillus avenaceus]